MDVKAKIVKTFPPESKVKAVASLTIGGCFAVQGVKIIDSANGPFVAMPNEKYKDEYNDICHPTTKEFRQVIIDAVLEAYEQNQSQVQTESKLTQTV